MNKKRKEKQEAESVEAEQHGEDVQIEGLDGRSDGEDEE